MTTKKYSSSVAISIVIANMVGTGVFTSLGYQSVDIKSGFAIAMLWLVGGIVALCGAFAYAEISTTFKRSGGEYHYLSEIYHPSLGFASGWVSLLVGFAAPIAVASLTIGKYFAPMVNGAVDPKIIAYIALAVIGGIHLLGVKAGGIAQNVLTSIKLLLILVLCIAPFFSNFTPTNIDFLPSQTGWDNVLSNAFAVSLVYVSLAYSGWNASAYIANDLENPKRDLPLSLIVGTLIVTVLYLLLNIVFLYTIPIDSLAEMQSKDFSTPVDVGNIAAEQLFGSGASKVFSGIFSFALLSTLSAMVIAGPRVAEMMGEDYKIFRQFSRKNENGSPYLAIIFEIALAAFLVTTSAFDSIVKYIGICLSFFATLTVFGVYVLRYTRPELSRGFKTWGYPVTPAIFIIINLGMSFYLVRNTPIIFTFSAITIIAGVVIYFLLPESKIRNQRKNDLARRKLLDE